MGFIGKNSTSSREKMLWASVLRRAVFDYVIYKGVRRKRLDWMKAHQYIFSEGARHENGLTFNEVCALFGWDPDYVRRLTHGMARSDIKRLIPSDSLGDLSPKSEGGHGKLLERRAV
jgi:hypothetical protein